MIIIYNSILFEDYVYISNIIIDMILIALQDETSMVHKLLFNFIIVTVKKQKSPKANSKQMKLEKTIIVIIFVYVVTKNIARVA